MSRKKPMLNWSNILSYFDWEIRDIPLIAHQALFYICDLSKFELNRIYWSRFIAILKLVVNFYCSQLYFTFFSVTYLIKIYIYNIEMCIFFQTWVERTPTSFDLGGHPSLNPRGRVLRDPQLRLSGLRHVHRAAVRGQRQSRHQRHHLHVLK